jgi:hypothetical protein
MVKAGEDVRMKCSMNHNNGKKMNTGARDTPIRN